MSGFGQPPGGQGQGGFGAPPGGAPPGGQPAGQPGPGGFGAPGPMGAPASPPPGDQPNFMMWLIIGIAGFFTCTGIFGGITAILAFLAKNDWEAGNAEGAQKKLKIAKILTIVGAILVGLGIIAYVIMMFAVVGTSAATSGPYSY